jgi:predicted transcriptional regulator YdeE
MKPVVVSAGDFLVAGLRVRTTHRIEAFAQTAKIPALWRRFFVDKVGDQIPDRLPDSTVLAVYSDYDRDDAGPYSMLIGHKVGTLEQTPNGMSGIWLLPARYLRFEPAGPAFEYPADAWAEIRQYFALTHDHERAYTADYEVHSAAGVAIYVAIK